MAKRIWKRVQPHSLSHAIELCIDHARERKNRSVDNIADLMGLNNKWVIYKWTESGKIPGVQIRAFEHACGIDLITRWLGHSAGYLMIKAPVGKAGDADEINALQCTINSAVGELIKFYNGSAESRITIAALTCAMEGMAWHRVNVEKHHQPELDFDGGSETEGNAHA
ncbi:MAG: hypothetical protein GXP10_01180 [Gammaproteobacteria bacterium]|nr:hypothetical protein [Gammaproteobacteria bacterium]